MTKTMQKEPQELAAIKSELSKVDLEQEIIIKTDEDLDRALAFHKGLKEFAKFLKAEKEKITKPLNDALKHWRGIFKPYEEKVDAAEGVTARKILEYRNKKAAQAEKKEDQIAQKVAEGKISAEEGIAKIDDVARPDLGDSHVRTYKVVEITDINKIPREFMVPDMQRIKDALKNGITVPGAELVDKQSLVA